MNFTKIICRTYKKSVKNTDIYKHLHSNIVREYLDLMSKINSKRYLKPNKIPKPNKKNHKI